LADRSRRDDAFVALLPAAHRRFLRSTELSYRCGDYFFAHAGVRPGVLLDRQATLALMWIRSPFLDSTLDHGAVVVHGHSIAERPQLRPNRIGIEPGLTAAAC
jgi:serine/threonine protein phosphatase 1